MSAAEKIERARAALREAMELALRAEIRATVRLAKIRGSR